MFFAYFVDKAAKRMKDYAVFNYKQPLATRGQTCMEQFRKNTNKQWAQWFFELNLECWNHWLNMATNNPDWKGAKKLLKHGKTIASYKVDLPIEDNHYLVFNQTSGEASTAPPGSRSPGREQPQHAQAQRQPASTGPKQDESAVLRAATEMQTKIKELWQMIEHADSFEDYFVDIIYDLDLSLKNSLKALNPVKSNPSAYSPELAQLVNSVLNSMQKIMQANEQFNRGEKTFAHFKQVFSTANQQVGSLRVAQPLSRSGHTVEHSQMPKIENKPISNMNMNSYMSVDINRKARQDENMDDGGDDEIMIGYEQPEDELPAVAEQPKREMAENAQEDEDMGYGGFMEAEFEQGPDENEEEIREKSGVQEEDKPTEQWGQDEQRQSKNQDAWGNFGEFEPQNEPTDHIQFGNNFEEQPAENSKPRVTLYSPNFSSSPAVQLKIPDKQKKTGSASQNSSNLNISQDQSMADDKPKVLTEEEKTKLALANNKVFNQTDTQNAFADFFEKKEEEKKPADIFAMARNRMKKKEPEPAPKTSPLTKYTQNQSETQPQQPKPAEEKSEGRRFFADVFSKRKNRETEEADKQSEKSLTQSKVSQGASHQEVKTSQRMDHSIGSPEDRTRLPQHMSGESEGTRQSRQPQPKAEDVWDPSRSYQEGRSRTNAEVPDNQAHEQRGYEDNENREEQNHRQEVQQEEEKFDSNDPWGDKGGGGLMEDANNDYFAPVNMDKMREDIMRIQKEREEKEKIEKMSKKEVPIATKEKEDYNSREIQAEIRHQENAFENQNDREGTHQAFEEDDNFFENYEQPQPVITNSTNFQNWAQPEHQQHPTPPMSTRQRDPPRTQPQFNTPVPVRLGQNALPQHDPHPPPSPHLHQPGGNNHSISQSDFFNTSLTHSRNFRSTALAARPLTHQPSPLPAPVHSQPQKLPAESASLARELEEVQEQNMRLKQENDFLLKTTEALEREMHQQITAASRGREQTEVRDLDLKSELQRERQEREMYEAKYKELYSSWRREREEEMSRQSLFDPNKILELSKINETLIQEKRELAIKLAEEKNKTMMLEGCKEELERTKLELLDMTRAYHQQAADMSKLHMHPEESILRDLSAGKKISGENGAGNSMSRQNLSHVTLQSILRHPQERSRDRVTLEPETQGTLHLPGRKASPPNRGQTHSLRDSVEHQQNVFRNTPRDQEGFKSFGLLPNKAYHQMDQSKFRNSGAVELDESDCEFLGNFQKELDQVFSRVKVVEKGHSKKVTKVLDRQTMKDNEEETNYASANLYVHPKSKRDSLLEPFQSIYSTIPHLERERYHYDSAKDPIDNFRSSDFILGDFGRHSTYSRRSTGVQNRSPPHRSTRVSTGNGVTMGSTPNLNARPISRRDAFN